MKIIFNYDANKTHFHNKGFALSLVLVVAQFLKKDKRLQITNICLFPGNSFRQLLASLLVLFYQLSFRQSSPNFVASSEVHAKVGTLKRRCANETQLGHNQPSKYILIDSLANDRRISYDLIKALTITVSLLKFPKVLFFPGWLFHFKPRGFVARSVAAQPHALKLTSLTVKNL